MTVPSGKLDDARLLLSDLGLGSSGRSGEDGFEVFDKSLFGMTDFVQKINHLRALQRSLEQKIRALEGVESAQVTLSIPEEELFTRDKESPKASVEVKLKRGRDVTRRPGRRHPPPGGRGRTQTHSAERRGDGFAGTPAGPLPEWLG